MGPYIHMGDLEEAVGSQLQASPALDISAIWGVNYQMKDFSAFKQKQISQKTPTVRLEGRTERRGRNLEEGEGRLQCQLNCIKKQLTKSISKKKKKSRGGT